MTNDKRMAFMTNVAHIGAQITHLGVVEPHDMMKSPSKAGPDPGGPEGTSPPPSLLVTKEDRNNLFI